MDDQHSRAIVDEPPIIHRVFNRDYTVSQLLFIDVVTVCLLAVLAVFVLDRDISKVHGSKWAVVGGIAYGVAALGTLFRRRWPLSALVFVAAIAFVCECFRAPGPTPFYTMMVLYSFVAVSTQRNGGLVAAGVAASVLLSTLVAQGGATREVAATIGGLALVGVGWLAGENTRASRAYESRIAERAAERAAAQEAERSEQIRRAIAEERAEIARELHDIVAHAMSVIAVRAGVARMVMATKPDEASDALAIIETTTRRALQEMRLLVGVLREDDRRPAEFGPIPGMHDLDRLVSEVAAAGVTLDVRIVGEPRALSPAASISGYRIVQEALTNVVRHVGPTRAHLELRFRPEELEIEVIDDGPQSENPRDPTVARQGTGHGLIGMRERASLFGGSLEAAPYGSGFRVRADLHTRDLSDNDQQVGDLE